MPAAYRGAAVPQHAGGGVGITRHASLNRGRTRLRQDSTPHHRRLQVRSVVAACTVVQWACGFNMGKECGVGMGLVAQ